MKKKLLILFVKLLLFCPLAYGQKSEPVNALSFNIRYDNPNDGLQNWHYRKDNILRMINFYDLDILGLQEVLINQLNFLKKHLNEYETVGVGRKDGKNKGEFAPIFFRKNKFELLESGTFWLSETPEKVSIGWDAALERIATWAVLKDKTSRKEFIVMNTHFDHIGK